ncbi:MAG: acyltransferase family protein [Flavobacteriales bacterium]
MTQSKKYFDNLDASRFFAFIIVFLAHTFIANSEIIKSNNIFQFVYGWGKIGMLGLEYFFVLSSFLISWIILEEQQITNSFNIKNFLFRRTLRVWPLYFLIVLIGIMLFCLAKQLNIDTETIPPFKYFGLFIINFYIIENGTNFLFFLAFLWSISIEEQFYIVWSIVMKYLKLNLLWLSILLIIISIVFRIYYINDSRQLYFNTISALGNFGIGGIIAYLAFYNKPLFNQIINIKRKQTIVFYIILVTSIVFFNQLNNYKLFTVFSRLYFSILFALFILEQSYGKNRFFNPGKSRILNHLGKISYGLYCFHGVVITILIKILEQFSFTETYWHVFLFYPIIILITTILISHLSFKYFENYFLKLKSKFYTFTSN